MNKAGTLMVVRERERERALFSQLKIAYIVRNIGSISKQVYSLAQKVKIKYVLQNRVDKLDLGSLLVS